MFTGGMAQGISQGLLANEESADRAELLKQRKLDTKRKEQEALQQDIQENIYEAGKKKLQLYQSAQQDQQGAPLPIPGQQPQQMAPQPPMPGQASVPNQPPPSMMQPQNAAQFMGNGGMPPPQGMPPQMQQQPPAPPMGMINQTQQRPMMTPNMQMQTGQAPQIPPYVDPNKMQQRPPMPQGQPTPPQAPPQGQTPQQPPPMNQGPKPISIGGVTATTPIAIDALTQELQTMKKAGLSPEEMSAQINRNKPYYEMLKYAETEADRVAQQARLDELKRIIQGDKEKESSIHDQQKDRQLGQNDQRITISLEGLKDKEKNAANKNADAEKLTPGGMQVAAELTRAGKSLPGGWSAKGMGRGNAVLNQMALEEEGGAGSGSIVSGQAKYKANSSALTQNTKDTAAILPFKEMLDTNIDVAIDLGKNIAKTNSALANKSINYLKDHISDSPDAKEYLAQIAFVQTEAARVLNTPRLVGQLTDSARKEMQDIVDGNTPINATERVLNRIKTDGNNRINALIKEGKKLESDLGGGNKNPSSKTVHWDDLK